jgi:hypothetical protein
MSFDQQSLCLVQPITFSSYLNHTSPNCQSPYKETIIQHNAWVIGHCNHRYSRMSFRYMVHLTSWWTPLNVKLMVSRHLLESTHWACSRSMTRASPTSVNKLYNRGFCTTNQQGYMTNRYAYLIRSYNNTPFILPLYSLYMLHRYKSIHYILHPRYKLKHFKDQYIITS